MENKFVADIILIYRRLQWARWQWL